MEPFFYYCINPNDEEPVMLINNFIGVDQEQGYGILGDVFQRELLALDQMDKKRIQVWINSPGGSVSDGYNIYSTILKTKTPVDTLCIGMAASIAGVIFQAGRKRVMMDYSWLMYHNPYDVSGNDNGIDTYKESLATMIATRSGKSEAEVLKLMNKTTYILADEALENGFCDSVEDSNEMNKKRKVSIPQNMILLAHRTNKQSQQEFFTESNKVINSLLGIGIKNNLNTNNMELTRVCNRLKLSPNTSEDGVLDAIDAIILKSVKNEEDKKKAEDDKVKAEEDKKKAEDDKTKSEEDLKALKDKLKKAEEDCHDLEAKIKKMEEDKKAEDDKKKAEDDEDKKSKAKNLIEGYVIAGKIPNDAKLIDEWKNKAFENLENVKTLFDSLTVNKKAVVMDKGTTPKGLAGSAANFMAAKLGEFMSENR